MSGTYTTDRLNDIYNRLHSRFGPQHWWPGETPWEVMVGAVLTQNTSWRNVEKAIDNLKGVGALDFDRITALPRDLLAQYIRPAGYYNIKAARLANLFALIKDEYGGMPEQLLDENTAVLREKLLSVKGIGPETADSILLYAARRPVFVVDAYTARILNRHDLITGDYGYNEIQEMFMDNLDADVPLFNEYHALLVRVGKEYCKKSRPLCKECPLSGVGGVRGYEPAVI